METRAAQKQVNEAEVIFLSDNDAESQKTCEYCNFKTKGERSLHKHQQATHFKCDACAMVAVSMKHLEVHKKSAHGGKRCDPCGVSFNDERRHEVHILKEHSFQCEECGEKYTRKATLDIHTTTKHPKEMKCIVCEYKALNETEITKHYEDVHLSSTEPVSEARNYQAIKCKSGPTCRYLRQDRCSFFHEESAEQPWERVQPRRLRQSRENPQPRPAQSRQMPRREYRQEIRQPEPRRQERRQEQPGQGQGQVPFRSNFRQQQPREDFRQTQPRQDYRQQQPRQEHWQEHPRQEFRQQHPRQEDRQQQYPQSRPETRQLSRGGDRTQGVSPGQVKPCKFGARCDRGILCQYLHMATDFLSLPTVRRR